MTKTRTIATRIAVGLAVVAVVSPAVLASMASAASLTAVTVRFDRMKISTPTTGMVCAKPTSVGTEATVKVTYPTGYTLGAAANFTVDTTTNTASWPTGAAAWTGIGTATTVSGQAVTFPSGDLTAATLYCFNWTNSAAVSVKSSATISNSGLVETYNVTPLVIESSPFSTASIADDQIAVSASVPQAFSFALSGNSDPLGTITSGTPKASVTPVTVTINTNAASGWNVWARDLNIGLTSATAGNTIAATTPGTNSILTGTVDGYNTGVTSATGGGSGTISVATPFVGGTARGGGLDTSLRTLATSNGTATNHVLTLTNNAAVAGATKPATDYADTITVVGAAAF